MLRRSRSLLLSALLLAALSGCIGGQTGQESRAEPPNPCTLLEPRQIAADEVTSLGFSARDVVGALADTSQVAFQWYQPDPGMTQAHFTVDAEPDSAGFASSDACTGYFEIDAVVSVMTDDGLLDEQFHGVLKADSPERATFSARIPLAEVRGRLDATHIYKPGQVSDPGIALMVSLQGGTVQGQLSMDGRDPNPNDSESPVSAALASF